MENSRYKFRAWDKKDKKMLKDWEGEYSLIEHFGFNGGDRFIVQQSVGLKDKNGKEIYGGDMFKNILGTVRVVAFDDGGFKLVKDRFFQTVAGDLHSLGDMNSLEARNGEVIGNIYENPNLLSQDK